MAGISVHNSQKELIVTPETIDSLGAQALVFTGSDNKTIPYRQFVCGEKLPGKYSMLIFLHGVGSVGEDNFLQMRIPGPPIIRYCLAKKMKAVILFPQCRVNCKWVDVPWDSLNHEMPAAPSVHMKLAMELLKSKIAEFKPDEKRIYAGGISMGGYGAWDIVSRMPETFAAVLPICGGADVRQAPKLKNLSVYTLHGDQDTAVPVFRSRDMVRALQACGNTRVIYRELPGVGHNAWDAAFADDQAVEWLFAQTK